MIKTKRKKHAKVVNQRYIFNPKEGAHGVYSSDLLSNVSFAPGESVFFLLFPYNEPDMVKIFKGEIMRSQTNIDFTLQYSIKVTDAFDKKDSILDFFHNNFFKTSLKVVDVQQTELNEGIKMFSFVDYELLEEIDENFSLNNYKTVFQNHTEKFTFLVNECFVFETYDECLKYLKMMNFLSVCKYLKRIHDIVSSKSMESSSLYVDSGSAFIHDYKHVLVKLIHEMGEGYEHHALSTKALIEFMNYYVLNRNIRWSEFDKNRKTKTLGKHKKPKGPIEP
jgi:hypothetical protein